MDLNQQNVATGSVLFYFFANESKNTLLSTKLSVFCGKCVGKFLKRNLLTGVE